MPPQSPNARKPLETHTAGIAMLGAPYVLKLLLPSGFLLLAVQDIPEIIQRVGFLMSVYDTDLCYAAPCSLRRPPLRYVVSEPRRLP